MAFRYPDRIEEHIWRMFFLSKWDTKDIAQKLDVDESVVWNKMESAREFRRGWQESNRDLRADGLSFNLRGRIDG